MDKAILYARYLTGRDTFASTLLAIAADLFGDECLPGRNETESFDGWDPETLIMELEQESGCRMSMASKNRLLAGYAVHADPSKFYQNLPSFIDTCNALTDGTFDPTVWDPAEVDEICWAIREMLILIPPDEDDPSPFSDEIVNYIGHACRNEGLIQAPDVLAIGLRDDNPLETVHDTFSDDPTMFQAVAQLENQKTKDIENFVQQQMSKLVSQLMSLPMPDTVEFAQKLRAAFLQAA